MAIIFLRSITESNFQTFIKMIAMNTEEWNFFVSLVDNNVLANDALQATRMKFPKMKRNKSLAGLFMKDLKYSDHE